MAENESGRFRRFCFWLCRYDLEVGIGVLVTASSLTMLYVLHTAPDNASSDYQAIMLVCALLLLFVATTIMFNVARTRVSAAEILDEMRRVDGKKTTADVI